VPTAPEKKLASGRSTAGGPGGTLPGGRRVCYLCDPQ
jgi:hypothetical protein